MLLVRLLGAFEVSNDGNPVVISSRPAQTLFAYLILNADSSHRREKLAGMLWPDSLEETARENLRHALWRVRKALTAVGGEDYLVADDLSIAFNKGMEYWLDAQALADANDEESIDKLKNALSAYQGELLPGFYDEWVVLEREHLGSIFEHQMARLMALMQSEGRWLEILDWAERWIKLGQKPEPAYRALMSAHAAKGDMSKVAATYERCIKALKEYRIEPSPQTKELYQTLKSDKEILASVASAAKPVTKSPSSNIPAPLTSFVGRDRELKTIARLLDGSRLLTLTGPGGVGKTRLAIQTAHDSRVKFKDGVFWVGLAGLSDPHLIPQDIAQTLNLRESSDEPLIETIKNHLYSRDTLLIIDNCEHLIRACAQYTEQLLAACPGLKVLATSIEALGLFDETIWQVPSLPLPESTRPLSLPEVRGFASVELFEERASHAKPGFLLTEENAAPVARICQRLDGIPLAIELAAARIKLLSVEEILKRLDDRFTLLTAGSRTAIPRHQTLRATIDWSYDILTEPERTLLRRLSVFVGGFTLEAAEFVCGKGMNHGDILDLLGKLVDKSLVIAETDAPLVETRYRLLETIRQYALEKLVETGEAPSIRDQHLEFIMNLAEEGEPNMYGSAAPIWFRRLDREADNVRAALEWATNNGGAQKALRIAGALVYFWFAHGLMGSEWDERVQQALSRPEGKQRTAARAKALNGIGFMYWADVYPTDRRVDIEEALSIGTELQDPWNIGTALRNLGLLENIQGHYEKARMYLEQSLETWRAMGSKGRMGYAHALIYRGDIAIIEENSESAGAIFQEAASILREPRDVNFLAYAVRRLGQLAWHAADFETAISLCKESLNLNQEVSDLRGIMACLAGFAAIAVAQDRFERAAQIMAAVETQLALIGIKLLYVDRLEYEGNLSRLRTRLEERGLARLWEKGAQMSLDEAIEFALQGS